MTRRLVLRAFLCNIGYDADCTQIAGDAGTGEGAFCARRRARIPRALIAVAQIAAALTVGACSDSSTAPEVPSPDVPVNVRTALEEGISDVLSRVVPNLPPGHPRSTVSRALRILSQELSTGRLLQIRTALRGADAAAAHVAPLLTSDVDASAELDAIRLELEAVAVGLDSFSRGAIAPITTAVAGMTR